MLPVLEVSRLSSASSFYSAVTQSLGLGYLAHHHPPNDPSSAPSNALVKHNPVLVFGDEYTDTPVFQLRLVESRPPRLAHIVLSASSLDAVNEFHAAALRAFPRSAAVIGTKESLNPEPEKHKHHIPSVEDYFSASHSQKDSTIVARVSDFDGNTMAVEYQPYQQSHYGGRSSHYDSSRVLDYSTSTSAATPSMFSPRYSSSGANALTTSRHRGAVTADMTPAYYDHYSSRNDRMGTLRRSATSASAASYESDPSTSSSSKGGMGSLGLAAAGAVGAMAGAAFTYTVMRSRSQSRGGAREREMPLEYNCAYGDDVPAFQRRETAPAAIAYEPEYAASRYSGRDNGGMRTSRTRSISSQKDVRQLEDVYDYKDAASVAPPPSYHTTYARSKAPSSYARSSRSRSEAPVDRTPLMLTSGSEKGAFDGYDYGNGYDGYEKSYEKSYEKPYEKTYEKYDKYDKYDKGDRYDKSDRYDKRSYVSERTERSRVPPNSSRSAPLRAPTYAPSQYAPSQSHSQSSRRSRSGSRSRGHYEYEIPNDSQATLVRSSSRAPERADRAESHAARSRGYSQSQSHSHRSDRSDRSDRGRSHHSHSQHAPRYDDYNNSYDNNYEDDDGDADSVTPDDSISCVGGRRYR